MNSISSGQSTVDESFLHDVISGLDKPRKQIHCKYLYDERGSQLFDQICELDEYYLTRTEQAIMDQYAPEMAAALDRGVRLVEFGSGSSTKSLVLLEHLIEPAAYVPLDISEEHLLATAEDLRSRFPDIQVLPLAADFFDEIQLPTPRTRPLHTAVYFPGSTIGNFEQSTARALLHRIAHMVGFDGGLLIGIDLQKDPDTILAAYDDAQGVTEQFSLNLLHRINEELGADFDVDQFYHLAEYNSEAARVEIFIVSRIDQTVTVGERTFEFQSGERIFTEYSHKYTLESFSQLAADAGFRLHHHWTDDQQRFAVVHLVVEDLPD